MPGQRFTRLSSPLTALLIGAQLLFAACAASVLVYRFQNWAPDIIDFGWDSYRAFNIYASLVLTALIVGGLVRRAGWAVPLLAAFALFHGVEGLVIGFWTKAALQLSTLAVLAWASTRSAPSLHRTG